MSDSPRRLASQLWFCGWALAYLAGLLLGHGLGSFGRAGFVFNLLGIPALAELLAVPLAWNRPRHIVGAILVRAWCVLIACGTRHIIFTRQYVSTTMEEVIVAFMIAGVHIASGAALEFYLAAWRGALDADDNAG